jgi:hypothetical protein
MRVPGNPGPISRALTRLLRDTPVRNRLGKIGKDRVGEPGAMVAITEELTR